jgi:hypothetical protein
MSGLLQRGVWRHLLVALGCVHLLGGPVAMLQLVAWAGMLVSYTAEDGLVQGVADTFSGDRPCPLCLKVREMEREQQKPALPAGEDRRRLAEALGQSLRSVESLDAPRRRGSAMARVTRRPIDATRPPGRSTDPETPPPRVEA